MAKRLNVNLNDKQYKELQKIAIDDDSSVSGIIRELVDYIVGYGLLSLRKQQEKVAAFGMSESTGGKVETITNKNKSEYKVEMDEDVKHRDVSREEKIQ